MRLVRGGPLVGIKLWYGPSKDPITGETLDRSSWWHAEANGEPIEFDRVWPQCAGEEISAKEYAFLRDRTQWAKRNDGYDPMANPKRKTNWDDSSVPTFGG